MKKTADLEALAISFKAEAEKMGLMSDYLFVSTFERYQQQIILIKSLEAQIDLMGVSVKKEYIKGRENVYANPIIADYNRACTAANGTMSALTKLMANAKASTKSTNALMDFISK